MDLGKKHHARAHTDSRKKDANTGRQALSLKPTIKPQLSTTSPKLINAGWFLLLCSCDSTRFVVHDHLFNSATAEILRGQET